jgi:hypothetical protein
MSNEATNAIGTGLAGGIIVTALLQTLLDKNLLASSDISNILDRAAAAVRRPVSLEEHEAFNILTALRRQFASSAAKPVA